MSVPQFFIDDDSGEPWQLFGDAESMELAARNAEAYFRVALEQLRDGSDGDELTLTIRRTDMTQAEVDALPEL